MTVRVWHYDGSGSFRYQPQLSASLAGLVLDQGAYEGKTIAWADLEILEGKGVHPAFSNRKIPGWQIGFEGPIPAEIAPYFPSKRKGCAKRGCLGLGGVAAVFALIIAAIIWLLFKTPGWLAGYVPMAWEEPLAAPMLQAVAPARCETPESKEALAQFVRKLDPSADVSKVQIVNIDMVNAVAIPGGSVLLFDGLLKSAKSPDEVAGVLGHEMGHVQNRDVMRGIIGQLGIGVLFGGFDMGVTQYLASQSFSRSAETNADEHAMEALKKARISPIPTAEFFSRMAADEEKKLGTGSKIAMRYLSSHPLSEGREAAFRESAEGQSGFVPSLSAEQWQALVDACKNDVDSKALPPSAIF